MLTSFNRMIKMKEWKEQGFDLEWLLNLAESPAVSDSCGLSGIQATSVIKTLEREGGIKRGKIQSNHKRIWLAGCQHGKWTAACRAIASSN